MTTKQEIEEFLPEQTDLWGDQMVSPTFKYKISDEVYLLHLNQIEKGEIIGINIDKNGIKYQVLTHSNIIIKKEEQVYRSIDEVMRSLKSNFINRY